ncbi:hypothetical protein BOTBODRAFT_122768 [Botryobasidium botryosum FD-172 SS1]|uniref:Tc1-like transposase DDE domain-containing protein n=1 Tax=Botryobasidium botryosum (strain FD-172 SS1) TaxID=930990 RepID=A0A067LTC3_BOTB1|nr:hypothetical protein BOTBODRAFT_122768 [Botryobasidium botryosum FD-172 SS1]
MRLLYLPPYSPDFNPIECAFSALKAWIRANRDYVLRALTGGPLSDPLSVLWGAVFMVMTPEKSIGWYRECGYV